MHAASFGMGGVDDPVSFLDRCEIAKGACDETDVIVDGLGDADN